MFVKNRKYRISKNSIVFLLLVSWVISFYAAEITNCRCFHSRTQNNIGVTSNTNGFSSQFKTFPGSAESNNCCSHKPKDKKQQNKCNNSCRCSFTKTLVNPNDLLITKGVSSVLIKDCSSTIFSSVPPLENIQNQNNSGPPLKPSANKIFIEFSSLRI